MTRPLIKQRRWDSKPRGLVVFHPTILAGKMEEDSTDRRYNLKVGVLNIKPGHFNLWVMDVYGV